MAHRRRRPHGNGRVVHASEVGDQDEAVYAGPAEAIARLQRQVGNRVVASLVRTPIQRLKEGDGPSHDVGVIQQQLNAAGAAPRVAITGRFDAATTAAAKSFQRRLIAEKVAGVVEDGIVDGVTHTQLKARAPSVKVSGEDTVVVGPGNTVVNDDPGGNTHLTLKIGATGTSVKELQERINNSPTMSDAARVLRPNDRFKLKVDGVFGPKTQGALKQFQSDQKIAPANGVADAGTWVKLMSAGAASTGHAEFDWTETVEGVAGVGLTARYDWKLAADRLTISVPINFVQKTKKNPAARISQWLNDITAVWNSFKATNHTDPKNKKSINIDFEAKRDGGAKTRVNVRPGNKRSDSSNWFVGDNDKGLAPHEYGHLIGLADEYNRDEGQYLAVTGEEPHVGNPAGDPAAAKTLATKIKAELPLTDIPSKPPKKGAKPAGTKLAGIVSGALGRNQGGFSRLVRQEYETANGTSLTTDIMSAFAAAGLDGFDDNKSAAIEPFLYSNRSIMGTMESLNNPVDAHDHPVEPRHIDPFVKIITNETSVALGAPQLWKPERR